jgi:hypothetical protein
MKYLVTLTASLAVSATLAIAYIAFPRTEHEIVQLPARPTLAVLKSTLGKVETIDTAVTLVDGRPFRCFQADSTFSRTRTGATWGMQWCWRTTKADFAAGKTDQAAQSLQG